MAQSRVNEPGLHILNGGICKPYVIDHDNGDDTVNGWYWQRGLLGVLTQVFADNVPADTLTEGIADGTANTLHSGASCCT